ncbi:hypothetical protein [Mesorhizobium sp. NFR06]|uniref:hypothetical protein n=1 Tax=Mesorhizobium sp. NFR06 TaxID=1566290 RepID=UPI00122DBFD8|nr:hypothetical protein [Mesorhizobium sp. NFR06]
MVIFADAVLVLRQCAILISRNGNKQRGRHSANCTFGHGRQAAEHGARPIAKSGIEGKDALDAKRG